MNYPDCTSTYFFLRPSLLVKTSQDLPDIHQQQSVIMKKSVILICHPWPLKTYYEVLTVRYMHLFISFTKGQSFIMESFLFEAIWGVLQYFHAHYFT